MELKYVFNIVVAITEVALLIAPLMELKSGRLCQAVKILHVLLIAPLMELKLVEKDTFQKLIGF